MFVVIEDNSNIIFPTKMWTSHILLLLYLPQLWTCQTPRTLIISSTIYLLFKESKNIRPTAPTWLVQATREVVNVLRRAVLTSASKFLFRLDDFISDRVSQTSKVSSDWHGGFCLLSEGEQVEVLMTGCERLFFMGGRVLAHPSTSNLSELRMNSTVIKWFFFIWTSSDFTHCELWIF